jgi:hypothetical protein
MNCVFLDTGKERILIETGIGEKWNDKQTSMYGIFREKPLAQTLFDKTGCTPDDITIVVNTHLHFDHAGGNSSIADLGSRIADFDRRTLERQPTEIRNPQSSIRNSKTLDTSFRKANSRLRRIHTNATARATFRKIGSPCLNRVSLSSCRMITRSLMVSSFRPSRVIRRRCKRGGSIEAARPFTALLT